MRAEMALVRQDEVNVGLRYFHRAIFQVINTIFQSAVMLGQPRFFDFKRVRKPQDYGRYFSFGSGPDNSNKVGIIRVLIIPGSLVSGVAFCYQAFGLFDFIKIVIKLLNN